MIRTSLSLAAGAFLLATAVVSGPAAAESFPPIKNQTVRAECGDCHMVFFPQMLPRDSWLKILNNMSSHFGEDASIEPDLLQEIIDFHTTRASDVLNTRAARKWRAGLKAGEAPDRITTAPRFVRKHDEHNFERMWKKYKVTSKADCAACHRDADRGRFEDD